MRNKLQVTLASGAAAGVLALGVAASQGAFDAWVGLPTGEAEAPGPIEGTAPDVLAEVEPGMQVGTETLVDPQTMEVVGPDEPVETASTEAEAAAEETAAEKEGLIAADAVSPRLAEVEHIGNGELADQVKPVEDSSRPGLDRSGAVTGGQVEPESLAGELRIAGGSAEGGGSLPTPANGPAGSGLDGLGGGAGVSGGGAGGGDEDATPDPLLAMLNGNRQLPEELPVDWPLAPANPGDAPEEVPAEPDTPAELPIGDEDGNGDGSGDGDITSPQAAPTPTGFAGGILLMSYMLFYRPRRERRT
jgi:hypothetical protein